MSVRQPPTERQVADWLALLGRLVAANMPPAEAKERLSAYTPLLLERYDSRDFNQVSREFVARNCKFFPSYGELCEQLDRWPKPAEKPLGSARLPWEREPEPERPPPSEEEIAAVHELVQQAITGMRESRLEQKSRPFPTPPKPLPDVTMRGDRLRASRAARGCNVHEHA